MPPRASNLNPTPQQWRDSPCHHLQPTATLLPHVEQEFCSFSPEITITRCGQCLRSLSSRYLSPLLQGHSSFFHVNSPHGHRHACPSAAPSGLCLFQHLHTDGGGVLVAGALSPIPWPLVFLLGAACSCCLPRFLGLGLKPTWNLGSAFVCV